jgi:DNA-binding NarL/FixJ family response regulator
MVPGPQGEDGPPPLSILVVEDDVPFARCLRRELRRLRVTPRLCTSVQAGRRALRDAWPDGAIVDVALPDGSGLDLLERARDGGWSGVALVQSGLSSPDVANRAHALEAAVVYKPFDLWHIRLFIERCLRHRLSRDVSVGRALNLLSKRAQLTQVEQAVAEGILRGMRHTDIAAMRGVSAHTVKEQVRGILRKTGAKTARDLVRQLQPVRP